MDTLYRDLRYAVRTLVRSPVFALVAILTLALGIGANTAIFSVVDALLLRPLPYPHPEQLVTVQEGVAERHMFMSMAYADVQELRADTRVFSRVAAYEQERYNLTAPGEPREVRALLATPGLFPLLGVRPQLGRGFARDEERAHVAVLSHRLWVQAYASDPGVIGRSVSLDDVPYTIVGVMAADFSFPTDDVELWLPIGGAFAADPQVETNRGYHAFNTVARLRPGVTLESSRAALEVLSRRLNAEQGGPRGAAMAGYATGRATAASGAAGPTRSEAPAGAGAPVPGAGAPGPGAAARPNAASRAGAARPATRVGAPANTGPGAGAARPGPGAAGPGPGAAGAGAGGRRELRVQMGGGGKAGGGKLGGMPALTGPPEMHLAATPLRDLAIGDVRDQLLLLFAAVALVLLIACANAAGLLVARANARRHEIAIRRAMGASRGRVARQLLTESVLLALAGGAGGLLLARWGLRAVLALWPSTLPHVEHAGVDARVLAFTFGLSLATGVLFGLLPALRASSPEMEEALKEESRTGTAGRRRLRAQSTLVVAETALALVLLVSAGLLVHSFVRLSEVKTGFDAENVLAARIRLTPARYSTTAAAGQFFDALVQRMRANPAVEAAAVSRMLPLSGRMMMMGMPASRLNPSSTEPFVAVGADFVSPGYFRTLGIPLLRGRAFTQADVDTVGGAVVINKAMAERIWPGEDPVGRTIPLGGRPGEAGRDVPIVGIVGNTHTVSLERDVGPELYRSDTPAAVHGPDGGGEAWLVVRARQHPLALVPAIRAAVAQLDPQQPVAEVVGLQQLVVRSTAGQRFSTTLVAAFAALALVLAIVGLYGLTAYAVAQRTRELGIRYALGARKGDVLRMLLGEGLALTGLGIALGLVLSLGVGRLLSGMLFGIGATDPITFAATALLLAAAALLAVWLPARRAAKVEPMVALRAE